MIPMLFVIIIGIGVAVLIGKSVVTKILAKTNAIERRESLERIRKLEGRLKQAVELLPHEDDVIDGSEETSEAEGLPCSAVMDAEDNEEE